MADKSSETVMASAGRNLSENIFITCLGLTLELAIIYFFTTILIFSGLYHEVWAIQTVGLLAIIHMIAVPVSYFGVKWDKRLLVLIGLLLSSIWFILVIVYIIVFIMYQFEGNDFKYRSLHHIILFYYSLLDLIIVIMLSINMINETQRHSVNKPPSPNSPTAPTANNSPAQTSTEKKTLDSDKSLRKK